MEQDINELKLKNAEVINNVFIKSDKFIELTHRINDLSLELLNINNKLETALKKNRKSKTFIN